jgi:predicted branched-subunit amino acid permease
VTTLVVNLRHLLYAVSLAPYLARLPQWMIAFLAFPLTDESYVVTINHYQRLGRSPYRHWFYIGSVFLMYTNWQIGTWIGIAAGQMFPNLKTWGLEFAFVATFIGILAPSVRSLPFISCSVAAGITALLCAGLPHQLGLNVAALVGVVSGLLVSRIRPERKPAREPAR